MDYLGLSEACQYFFWSFNVVDLHLQEKNKMLEISCQYSFSEKLCDSLPLRANKVCSLFISTILLAWKGCEQEWVTKKAPKHDTDNTYFA